MVPKGYERQSHNNSLFFQLRLRGKIEGGSLPPSIATCLSNSIGNAVINLYRMKNQWHVIDTGLIIIGTII